MFRFTLLLPSKMLGRRCPRSHRSINQNVELASKKNRSKLSKSKISDYQIIDQHKF